MKWYDDIDNVLRILSELNNEKGVQFHKIFSNPKNTLTETELETVLQFLIDNNFVKSWLWVDGGTVSDLRLYKISLEGLTLLDLGGYGQRIADINNERDYKKRYDSRMEDNAFRLYVGTWVLAGITFILMILEAMKDWDVICYRFFGCGCR